MDLSGCLENPYGLFDKTTPMEFIGAICFVGIEGMLTAAFVIRK